jgi:hypothetical protein
MTENNRSFGQGAQGEPEAPKVRKVSLLTRLRYNFDNSIAKSGAFVAYMFGALIGCFHQVRALCRACSLCR